MKAVPWSTAGCSPGPGAIWCPTACTGRNPPIPSCPTRTSLQAQGPRSRRNPVEHTLRQRCRTACLSDLFRRAGAVVCEEGRSMKVLLVSLFHPEIVRGGAQQVCYELFQGLKERDGVDV